MIIQVVSDDTTTTDLTFTVPAADYERARAILEGARGAIGYTNLQGNKDVVKISAIGIGMRSHAGVAARAFRGSRRQGRQHPRHHHLGDQVLAADRRRLYRTRGAHAAHACSGSIGPKTGAGCHRAGLELA